MEKLERRRLVYLAGKDLFRNIEISEFQQIRAIVQANPRKYRTLLEREGSLNIRVPTPLDRICNLTWQLKSLGYFDSSDKAQELLASSSSPVLASKDRKGTPAQAVTSASPSSADSRASTSPPNHNLSGQTKPEASGRDAVPRASPSRPTRAHESRLDPANADGEPIYLAFGTRDAILSRARRLLEAACCDYIQVHVPQLLRDQQWEETEAVELHVWAKTLPSYWNRIAQNSEDIVSRNDFGSLMTDVADIRHAAIHRNKLTASKLMDLLISAKAVASLFQDRDRALQIQSLVQVVMHCLTEIESRKEALQRESAELRGILQEQQQLLERRMNFEEERLKLVEEVRQLDDAWQGLQRREQSAKAALEQENKKIVAEVSREAVRRMDAGNGTNILQTGDLIEERAGEAVAGDSQVSS